MILLTKFNIDADCGVLRQFNCLFLYTYTDDNVSSVVVLQLVDVNIVVNDSVGGLAIAFDGQIENEVVPKVAVNDL